MPKEHRTRLGEAFTLSRDGRHIVYALHPDRPGEQTGNRGPGATLWLYDIAGEQSTLLHRWPSRIFRISPGVDANEIQLESDQGGAHNNVWHLSWSRGEVAFQRLTVGLADEDWPSASLNGIRFYTDNTGNSTRIVRQSRDGKRQDLDRTRVEFKEPVQAVSLRIRIADPELPRVARLSLRRREGRFHFPVGALYRITAGLRPVNVSTGDSAMSLNNYRPLARFTARCWPLDSQVFASPCTGLHLP